MKFNLLKRSFNLGGYSKYTLLVLILSIFVLGAKVVSSTASVQSLRMADVTTKSADGKTIKAKPGFELVRQGDKGVVARKKGETTKVTSDVVSCTCFEFTPCERTTKRPCCNHKEGQSGSCIATDEGAQTYSCKGSCDQCKWQ
ncbi:MAG: hypothetical protein JST84_26905 [Acidobacteria bacterium]|nr:hypothetical protein [Acidobacteriota bacterium]